MAALSTRRRGGNAAAAVAKTSNKSAASPTTSAAHFTDQQLHECFDLFDLDHNGYITTHELRHVYRALGNEVSGEEIMEMLRIADAGGNGAVDLKCFSRMINRIATAAAMANKEYDVQITSNDVDTHAADDAAAISSDSSQHDEQTATAAEDDDDESASPHQPLSIKALIAQLGITSTDCIQLVRKYSSNDNNSSNGDRVSKRDQTIDYDEMLTALKLPASEHTQQLFELFLCDDSDTHINGRDLAVTLTSHVPGCAARQRLQLAFSAFAVEGALDADQLEAMLQCTQFESTDKDRDEHIAQLQAIARSISDDDTSNSDDASGLPGAVTAREIERRSRGMTLQQLLDVLDTNPHLLLAAGDR